MLRKLRLRQKKTHFLVKKKRVYKKIQIFLTLPVPIPNEEEKFT